MDEYSGRFIHKSPTPELFGPACSHRAHTDSVVQHHVVGPALALPYPADLRTGSCPHPHRQGFPQSSGFYLPDPLRAPALGAEEEVTPGNEYRTDRRGRGDEGVRLGHQLLRRVGKMVKSPRREQQASESPEEWNKLPQGLAVALATPPSYPTGFPW